MMSRVGSAASRRVTPLPALAGTRARGFMSSMEDYGKHCFKGAEADAYLALLEGKPFDRQLVKEWRRK